MIKKYFTVNGREITFPVTVKNNRTFVTVGTERRPLVTSDKEVQDQVERYCSFRSGVISAVTIDDNEEVAGAAPFKEDALTDITVVQNINDAKDWLEHEPYNVPAGTIRTLSDAREVGKSFGLSFSNLK